MVSLTGGDIFVVDFFTGLFSAREQTIQITDDATFDKITVKLLAELLVNMT